MSTCTIEEKKHVQNLSHLSHFLIINNHNKQQQTTTNNNKQQQTTTNNNKQQQTTTNNNNLAMHI